MAYRTLTWSPTKIKDANAKHTLLTALVWGCVAHTSQQAWMSLQSGLPESRIRKVNGRVTDDCPTLASNRCPFVSDSCCEEEEEEEEDEKA